MQHLLRALSGPQAGAVYVLGPRTILGRANNCDVQLLHGGVSRQHARITQQPDGSMVVSDLSSDNGTYLEGERISAQRLISGQQIRVLNSNFIYEVVDDDHEAVTSEVFRRKVTSGDSLRRTADHRDAARAAVQASLEQERIGGVAQDRGRPHSRPQAAAPALSGARPGAATGGGSPRAGAGAGTRKVPITEQQTLIGDSSGSSTSLPAMGLFDGYDEFGGGPAESGAYRVAGPARRTPSSAPPADSLIRPFARASSEEAASTYGWHSRAGQRRRDRVDAVPTSLAVAATPEAHAVKKVGARGGAAAQDSAPDRPAVASPSNSGAGWNRVAPPVETPGSMRPRSTWTGMPQVEVPAGEHPGTSGPSRAEPTPVGREDRAHSHASLRGPTVGEAPRRSSTAEYRSAAADSERPKRSATPATGEPAFAEVRRAAPGEGARLGQWSSDAAEDAGTTPREQTHARARSLRADGETDDGLFLPGASAGSGAEDEATAQPEVSPQAATHAPEETQRFSRSELAKDIQDHEATLPFAGEPVVDLDDDDDDELDSSGAEDTLRFQRRGQAEPSTDVGPCSDAAVADDDEPEPDPNALQGPRTTLPPLGVHDDDDDDDDVGSGEGVVVATDSLTEDDRARLRVQVQAEYDARKRMRRAGINALLDILEYRAHRLRELRGDAIEAAEAERFTALAAVLQQDASPDEQQSMRRYERFECRVPAKLTFRRDGTSERAEVEVADLSAGGAKITFSNGALGVGDAVRLVIALEDEDRARLPEPDATAVLLSARVVWTRPLEAEVGLIFAGAPRFSRDTVG